MSALDREFYDYIVEHTGRVLKADGCADYKGRTVVWIAPHEHCSIPCTIEECTYIVIGRPYKTFTAAAIVFESSSIVVDDRDQTPNSVFECQLAGNSKQDLMFSVTLHIIAVCREKFKRVAATNWWQQPTFEEANRHHKDS